MSSRRLSRRLVLGGTAAAAGVVVDSLLVEPHWLEVTVHDIGVSGLPRSLAGLTLAQVTDAHLSQLGQVEQAIVAAVREHAVRLVVLTGDLVDSSAVLHVLSEFVSELGKGTTVVATLGNWEHWGGIVNEDLVKAYRKVGAQLLVNTSRMLDGLQVCATDDSTAGRPRFTMLPDRPQAASLLLTHSPELLDAYPRHAPQMALSLAGHTHGGQVRLGSAIVPFLPPGSGRFVAGWYETPAGRAYVSRGSGTSIAPARFCCRPELPIFRLQQA